MSVTSFSKQLLDWFKQHGRHDLPWQLDGDPYRVWVSEIMLQQTQVATVIPYYLRFMQRFTDVQTLAAAELDEVLQLWTGLGYYARARNLHRSAKMVVNEFHGQLPESLDSLMSLPGIGRSTAGAILALAHQRHYAILDGNVKRVLTRYHAIAGWPGNKSVENKLWELAEKHTPEKEVAAYTQAMMDLGATVCTRRQPECVHCPLNPSCQAYATSSQRDYPSPKPRKSLPKRETVFVIIENREGEFLMEQRPPMGIWGGLWCFPQLDEADSITVTIKQRYGYHVLRQTNLEPIEHTFSHFHLKITPVLVHIGYEQKTIDNDTSQRWLAASSETKVGYPAPVVSLLKALNHKQEEVVA